MDFLEKAKALMPVSEMEIEGFGKVYIRGLSANQIRALMKAAEKPTPKGRKGKGDEPEIDDEKLTLSMLALSLTDKDGNHLVPEGRESEIFDLPHQVVRDLNRAVSEINGMATPESAEGNS